MRTIKKLVDKLRVYGYNEENI